MVKESESEPGASREKRPTRKKSSGSRESAPRGKTGAGKEKTPARRTTAGRPVAKRSGARGRSRSASPPPPSLAWAKWIEALSEGSGTPSAGEDEAALAKESPGLPDFRRAQSPMRLPKRHDGEADIHEPSLPRAPSVAAVFSASRPELVPDSDRALAKARPAALRAAAEKALNSLAVGESQNESVAVAEAASEEIRVDEAEPREALTTPEQAPLADDPLPERYGEDRVTLIARDPYWLHAYWEITDQGRHGVLAALAPEHESARLTLRTYIYNAASDETASDFFDTELPHPDIRVAYAHAARPGLSFEAEIGFKGASGRFVAVARSRRVTAPRDRMSDITDAEWLDMTPGEHLVPGLLPVGWQPAGGSLELAELMAGGPHLETVGSGGVSSFSIPHRYERKRAFWFKLETELIVHGATEPGAHVTCQGRPVPLRSDGTFTLRFALPDGKQVIPCAATSPDFVETITITPRVEKETSVEHEESPAAPAPATDGRAAAHEGPTPPHRGAPHLVTR